MNIYQEFIIDHYRNPRNFGILKNNTDQTSVFNPLCGDRIEMYIIFQNNKVADIKFKGQGCAISQASASLLTEIVKDKTKEYLKKLDKGFMIKLLSIELGPNRIRCALLPLEALHKLLI